MASVQVYTYNNKKYVRVVESYRDPETKKPKTRTIQTLGRLDKLEEENPNILAELKEHYSNIRKQKDDNRLEGYNNFIKNLQNNNKDLYSFDCKNYGYMIYEKIWDELKLDYFFDYRKKQDTKIQFNARQISKLLTISRLIQPASKVQSFENSKQFLNFDLDSIELNHIYKTLGFLANEKHKLEKHLNKKLFEDGNHELSVCFYDVTTYYFESQKADELKNFGFSKDNKINQVQVVMGLLIDNNGIPITYELYPGNTNEFKTMLPILEKLKNEYGIKKVVVTADRGLNSKENLAKIRELGYDYVISYKIKSASKNIKKDILSDGYEIINNDMKAKEIFINQKIKIDDKNVEFTDKLLLTYSYKRAEKDSKDRERLVNKAIRLTNSPANLKQEMKKGGKKYVNLEATNLELSLDENKITDDSLYDGYYGVVTSDHNLSINDILSAHHMLWKIEESFKLMKTNLEARPLFVWSQESIKGHFVLCYLALFIQRLLEYKLKRAGVKLSTSKIQNACKSANITVIPQKLGTDDYLKNSSSEEFSQILRGLNLKDIPSVGKVTKVKF